MGRIDGFAGRAAGPAEHQRKLDERFAVETELLEAVRMNRAGIEQLERRTDELLERQRTTDRVIEEILSKKGRTMK